MNTRTSILLFHSLLIIIPELLFQIKICSAQQNDAGLWISGNLEKKITQKFSCTFSEELRFNENATELGTFFSDIGVSYSWTDNIKTAWNYRFLNKKRPDGAYSKGHRYYFDFAYRKKIQKFTLQFRYRFQSQYTDIFTSEDGKIPSYTNRYKLSCRYVPAMRIKPYLSVEFFENLDGYIMDKIRYSAGMEYALNKRNAFEIFYLLQKEYNVNDPLTDYVFGIGYNFIF